jgi:hypothetical protein
LKKQKQFTICAGFNEVFFNNESSQHQWQVFISLLGGFEIISNKPFQDYVLSILSLKLTQGKVNNSISKP